jgi:nucleoid-associated protein YgaU/DNA-binding SARP family transcriptional activator
MSTNTRPTRAEIAEGLGALFVIAIGLVGIPLLLATIVGWPLPHHLPTAGQLHSAAGSQIPDAFWPKALAVIAWLAWGYFVFSLTTATIDVIRFRHRGTWRRAAGKTSMAALVTAIIVLTSIRGSTAAHRVGPMPAVTAVVDVSPAPAAILSASQPAVLTYTVAPGDSLWDIAVTHYGNGEQWHTIYAANVGALQPDGRALDATNWIYPGWKLTIPDVPTATTAPVVELTDTAVPSTTEVIAHTVVAHTVVAGDNLWDIAATYYGNGGQWHTIYDANVGVDQPGGAALSDPSLIDPGWTLTIPEAASSAPAAAVPSTQAPAPSTPAPPPPTTEIPTPPVAASPASVPLPAPHSAPHSVSQLAPEHQPRVGSQYGHPTVPSPLPTVTPALASTAPVASPHQRERVPAEPATSHAPRHLAEHRGDPELPAIAIGGLGVLAAAVIARSLQRRRRIARVTLRPGEMIAASSAPIRDLESALAALVETPAVDWLDLAMRHLTQVSDGHSGAVPPIRLVRVGNDGVDLILAEAAGVAPGAFEVAEDGWAWTLPNTTDLAALADASKSAAWFAALVPVGEDEDGQTYLAPIEPGTVLPVTGPGAEEVLAAMATTANSWSWTEHVTVTSDPTKAAAAAQVDPLDPSMQRDRVLYIGSPTGLAPEVLSSIGILTIDDVAGSDLSVLCLGDATVEITPTQLCFRACRLTPEAHAGIAEALCTAETPPSAVVPEHQMVLGGTVDRDTEAEPERLVTRTLAGVVEPELEVRLLTNAATITGASERATNRNGRRFELVALLALSGGLTKEDARSAIYGSGSSTGNITNIAYKARKMLGSDSDGQPFLPEASSRGVLRLSPRVTTDLARLVDAVNAAAGAKASEAMALYASVLDLIEVTPAAAVNHPWNWWVHYAALAERAALAAACDLARLTIETKGDIDSARRGIHQARALAPYAEELYRAAIELAGAAGNVNWAQREWDELHRMLDELSPGMSPSPETQAVYQAVMQPGLGADNRSHTTNGAFATVGSEATD